MCLLLVHTSYVMMHWVPSSRGGDINFLYGSSSAVWCVGCIIHQPLHQPPNTTISQCEEVICHAGKVAHWVPLKPTLSSVSLCNELHLTDVVWLFALNTHQLKPLIGFSWSVYIQYTLCVCTCMSVYVRVHIWVCIWFDVSLIKNENACLALSYQFWKSFYESSGWHDFLTHLTTAGKSENNYDTGSTRISADGIFVVYTHTHTLGNMKLKHHAPQQLAHTKHMLNESNIGWISWNSIILICVLS